MIYLAFAKTGGKEKRSNFGLIHHNRYDKKIEDFLNTVASGRQFIKAKHVQTMTCVHGEHDKMPTLSLILHKCIKD